MLVAGACAQTLRGGRVKLQTIMVPETEYTHHEKVMSGCCHELPLTVAHTPIYSGPRPCNPCTVPTPASRHSQLLIFLVSLFSSTCEKKLQIMCADALDNLSA